MQVKQYINFVLIIAEHERDHQQAGHLQYSSGQLLSSCTRKDYRFELMPKTWVNAPEPKALVDQSVHSRTSNKSVIRL